MHGKLSLSARDVYFTPSSNLDPIRWAKQTFQCAHDSPSLCSLCQWVIRNTLSHSQKCPQLGDN